MRLKADKKKDKAQNHNVEIYGNRMLRIRDNPVEPERAATNWWVHHNEIHNAHAWFSLDEVAGGFWYVFANTGWITDKPGSQLDPNRGGKVYKYDAGGVMPTRPVFAFNNSYYLYNSLIKDGATTFLTHRNNAVLFRNSLATSTPQDKDAQCPLPAAVLRTFADGNTGDERFLGDGFMPGGWTSQVSFDCDLTNIPWPPKIVDNHQEANGRVDTEAMFVDPDQGDLRLAAGPPRGCPLELAPGRDWPGAEAWTSGAATPMGAYGADGKPVAGPAFVFLKPEESDDGYTEMPRLVRIEQGRGELALLFFRSLGQPASGADSGEGRENERVDGGRRVGPGSSGGLARGPRRAAHQEDLAARRLEGRKR